MRAAAASIGALLCLFAMAASLKLQGCIDWSWWWITLPLWGVLVIVGMFLRK